MDLWRDAVVHWAELVKTAGQNVGKIFWRLTTSQAILWRLKNEKNQFPEMTEMEKTSLLIFAKTLMVKIENGDNMT